MTKLETLLATLEELDNKWVAKRPIVGKIDPSRLDRVLLWSEKDKRIMAKVEEQSCDAEYLIAAANAIPTLIKIVRVQREALIFVELLHVIEDKYPDHVGAHNAIKLARKALEQCEGICGKE